MAKILRMLAFTLVELLVVIVIIVVLVALLFPALKKAKEAAKEAKELNLMKQMLVANTCYGEDFNQSLILYSVSYPSDTEPWYWTYFVAYAVGKTPKSHRNEMNLLYLCSDDNYLQIVKYGYGPSFAWHVASLRKPGAYPCLYYPIKLGEDKDFNVTLGCRGIFTGNAWPRSTMAQYPSTQVLSRCPLQNVLRPQWSHDNRRANGFFDGHVKRIKQPTDTALGD